ncbi:MAG: Si-specific NAD(P)(+) transhydrogenase [Chloroflexi bacterium]|nr:Si-specific NAD(P)(+) transhydrogenase [Chloroflexota bacterium]
MDRYDIAIVGTGPAGQRAAIQAAKLGASVAAIEKRSSIGGAAIHAGTIPSKTLREAALYLTGFRQRVLYGADSAVKKDLSFNDLTFRLDSVLDRELSVMQDQLRRNNVEVIFGNASFSDEHTLRILTEGVVREIGADKIVLAPGTVPAKSDKVPINGRTTVDADSIFDLPAIPRTLTVIGAGIIGVEYGGIFAAMGVKVNIVDQRPDFLEFVDRGIIEALQHHMTESGVEFYLGEELVEVSSDGSGVTAYLKNGVKLESDVLLYTIGRSGATESLGLGNIGLEIDDRGRISVDEYYRTAISHIYAVGDVIGFPGLAASAIEQGRLAARHAMGAPLDELQTLLPYGIYAVPEISMVGLTAEQLESDGVPFVTGIARYAETARGHILGDRYGHLRLYVHSENRSILGVHIIGENATELIHIGQTVMSLNGTLDYLVNTVFNYPTLAECYKTAALDAFNRLTGAPSTASAH